MNRPPLEEIMRLAEAEFLQVHALCDRCNVPRNLEGAEFSAAQRVAILAGVAEGLMRQVGSKPVTQQ